MEQYPSGGTDREKREWLMRNPEPDERNTTSEVALLRKTIQARDATIERLAGRDVVEELRIARSVADSDAHTIRGLLMRCEELEGRVAELEAKQ